MCYCEKWPWPNNSVTMPPTPLGPNLIGTKKLSIKKSTFMDEIIQNKIKYVEACILDYALELHWQFIFTCLNSNTRSKYYVGD